MIIDDFYLSKSTKETINKWKSSYIKKKQIKPLFINGNSGSGKTSLANILLKEQSIINININTNNKNDLIELILGKKDISMLFSNKKYKAIIIDDIFINNKKINEFSKSLEYLYRCKNNLVIIINSSKLESIQKIIDKCYYIDISYNKKRLFLITKKICLEYNLHLKDSEINNIIAKCNNNINSIKENIKYLSHKNENSNNHINSYDVNNSNTSIIKLTEELLDRDCNLDISNKMLKYNFDCNIILLNLIDNIINITNDIDLITKIYKNILNLDMCDYININNNNYELYIFYCIIYSTYNIKKTKVKITYNKYISYSLQYLNKNQDTKLYYYFKDCLDIYFTDVNKKQYFEKLKTFCNKNNIKRKNVNSIIRLTSVIKDNKQNKYTYLLNKLFNNLK